MSGALAPSDEAAVAQFVAAAHLLGEPLLVQGGGTKASMLRPEKVVSKEPSR